MFIVLITSRSGKENFLTGMSAGADDFMTKPLDADELLVRMHSAERVIHLQSEAQIQAAIAAELREIDRMKSTFISLTSHELRSPLSLILLNLELLSTNKALRGTDCQKTIVSLSANAQRLWRIVEETLKASKNGKYVKELNLEPVDINVLIRDTVNGVTPFAALRSQHIEVETEMDFPEIWLDPGKISDALANLLMNAIKFTPDNMTIQVKACREDSDAIRISVIDPGMGVSDIDKPHMFEQLFSTLAIVKDFVEMHGGTVGFESEEGHGSCFHLTIPIAP